MPPLFTLGDVMLLVFLIGTAVALVLLLCRSR